MNSKIEITTVRNYEMGLKEFCEKTGIEYTRDGTYSIVLSMEANNSYDPRQVEIKLQSRVTK